MSSKSRYMVRKDVALKWIKKDYFTKKKIRRKMARRSRKMNRLRSGQTLIEIMILVAIGAIGVAIITGQLVPRDSDKGKLIQCHRIHPEMSVGECRSEIRGSTLNDAEWQKITEEK